MRSILSVLLPGIICLLVNKVFAQPTFEATYQLQKSIGSSKLLQFPNGGTIRLSNSETGCNPVHRACREYVTAFRVNTAGALLWQKSYSVTDTHDATQVQGVTTTDGGFAFFQNLIDTATSKYRGGLLVKCNASGAVEWSKQVVSKTYVHIEPYVLGQDDDGGFLLLYSVAKDRYSSAILQIAKVSAAGQLLWYKTVQTTDFYYSYYVANSVHKIKNKYFIAGEFNDQYLEGVLTSTLLVLNSKGSIDAFKQITIKDKPSTYYNTFALRAFANGSQYGLLGTYVNNDPAVGYRYYLLPLSDTTTLATGTMIPYTDFALQRYLRAYKDALPYAYYYTSLRKNGSLATLSSLNGSSYLKQYDSLGRICPAYTLPSIDTQLTTRTFSVSDNTSYKLMKDSVYLTDMRVYISSDSITYTLNCTGSLSSFSSVAEMEQKTPVASSSIQIYPNPASSFCIVSGLPFNAAITVTDALGRVVIGSNHVSAAQYRLDVSKLSVGMYYLQVKTQGKAETLKFIKSSSN